MITYNKINSTAINQDTIKGPKINKVNTAINRNLNFNEILQKSVNKNIELKFSKHASERLEQRNIKLSTDELNKINNAIETASKKGIKETLILMDNKAFIANVKNKIIITAAIEDQLRDNAFTNIDGAIII